MTLRSIYSATAVVFAFSAVTVGPAYAQRRDGNLLPQDKSGQVTAVGCLVKASTVRGGKDKYVLARVKKGPVPSVPEQSCTADSGADALQLDHPEKAAMTDAMLGRWVEIKGELEKETSKDPDNLRELDVLALKMVPVIPKAPPMTPRATAGSTPTPAPARPRPASQPPQATAAPATAAPAAEPAPAAAPARKSLPKTASNLPAVGLAGLLALAASLAVRWFRLRQQG